MIQETDGGWGFDSACAVLSPTAPCGNTCNSAPDGACDDGGPGAEFSSCFFGTDCADCGPRSGMSSPPPPLCVNTCSSANSWTGSCDDGGPGSSHSNCALGTDCYDCGSRPPAPPLCSNTCGWASNGECDDGGLGAEFYACNYGTDCSDCGPRTRIPNQANSIDGVDDQCTPSPPPPSFLCLDSCTYASDSSCDDGGPGSEFLF
eukprot:jgi/Chrpa1/18820/Chrysochromulina_OHIO_Genome00025698-RA